MNQDKYITEVNRVADDVWTEFQRNLGITYEERIRRNAGVYGFPDPLFSTHGEDYVIREDTFGHGLTSTAFYRGNLIIGPIKIANVPESILKVYLEHEFSHFIAYRSDPHYGVTMDILKDHSAKTQPKAFKMLVDDFCDLFNESLAWIPPYQFSGREAVLEKAKHDARNAKRLTQFGIDPEALLLSNKMILGLAETLHYEKAIDAKILLKPMSIMTENHPLIEKGSVGVRKVLDGFMEIYKIAKRRGVKVYVDDIGKL